MSKNLWQVLYKITLISLPRLLLIGGISLTSVTLVNASDYQHKFSANEAIKSKTASENKQLKRVGRFKVIYQPSANSSHQKLQTALQESRLFDGIIKGLNDSQLVLRVDLPVILQDCGQVNAFYNPQQHTITICHEFIFSAASDFERITESPPREALEKALYATIFAFFHELGHALIDVLELPTVGQEEDAVDEFAAIIFLNSDTPETAEIVLNGAIWFGSQPQGPFWDEHPPSDKRFFNLLCLVYGSNPQKYAPIIEAVFKATMENQAVEPEALQRRAALCEQEYPKKLASWNKLLLPHFAQGHGGWRRSSGAVTPPPPSNRGRRRVW